MDVLYDRINIFRKKNLNLYNNALINYCELNIQFYHNSRALGFEYKKYKRDFNNLMLALLKNKKIKNKTKLRYIIYYVSPRLYELLFYNRL